MRRRALRRRYGRTAIMSPHQTAYGTYVEGRRIFAETGARLATFSDKSDAVRAWSILAEVEGRFGDSARFFDSAAWRGVRTLWAHNQLQEVR